MERKTVHIREDFHKEVKKFAIDKDLKIKEAYDRIIADFFDLDLEED